MGGATAPAPAKKAAPAPKPAAKVASTPKPSLGGGSSLSGHEDWELFNSKVQNISPEYILWLFTFCFQFFLHQLAKVASGNGMKNLKKAFESTTNLPDVSFHGKCFLGMLAFFLLPFPFFFFSISSAMRFRILPHLRRECRQCGQGHHD
jgi:hypothetical protein